MVVFVNNTRASKESGMSTNEDNTFRRLEDWERLAVLEVRVNDHSEDLKQVFKHQEILSEGVASINSTLLKILYTLVGAGTFLVLQERGLVDTFFALLG